MVSISGTDITMTRGDTLALKITMTKDGVEYTPGAGDSVRFAMKVRYTDEEVILEKNIPIDTMVLEIEPKDTKSLEMRSSYVYDIQLTTADGKVDTFIMGNLTIDVEVK